MSEFISKIDMLKESQREIYLLIEKDKADEFNKRIDAILNYYQAENSELRRKLDLAIDSLVFVIKNSGLSCDYNLRARKALAQIRGVRDEIFNRD